MLTGDGDVAYTQLSLSMEDAQFVQQRELSTIEICRIFRVPPHMLGAAMASRTMTYSNITSEVMSFQKFSLTPLLTLIEQAISGDPDLSPATIYVEFDLDRLLRADSAERAAYYTAALNPLSGWMTRQEVRAAENLPLEDDVSPAPSDEPMAPQMPTEAMPSGPVPIAPNDPAGDPNA